MRHDTADSRKLIRIAAALLAAAVLAGNPAAAQFGVKVLHSEKSLYRTIFVYEDGGERCLRFTRREGIRQSCIQLDDPDRHVFSYTKMMMGALYLRPAPRHILIVGLGGGILPTTLAKVLPDADIDVAEIDPAVTRVARTYFGFRTSPKLRVFEEDGRVYVKHAIKDGLKYDLVMLDAFDQDYIPEHLLTREFLAEVKSVLTPDGVLAANTFSNGRLYDNESVTYQAVYGSFFNLKSGNRIILTEADGLPSTDAIARNAKALDGALARFGIEPGWLLPLFSTRRDWRDRPVLTDQYSPSNLLNDGR